MWLLAVQYAMNKPKLTVMLLVVGGTRKKAVPITVERAVRNQTIASQTQTAPSVQVWIPTLSIMTDSHVKISVEHAASVLILEIVTKDLQLLPAQEPTEMEKLALTIVEHAVL